MLFSLYGCKSEITSDDVSKAIANIYSDSEGNVTIALSDGREFNLGNMKGEKGDKGDKGDPGINGIDGKDGINGKNGIDGKNGVDGNDGANGANGRDGSSITDYVQDVTLTDENILTITYGDGTVNELSRIDLEDQYIIKVYADLYDLDDTYVTSVLYNYFCYEEGDTRQIYIEYPFEYDNKMYGHLDFGEIPEDISVTHSPDIDDEGPYFTGIMPSHDSEYHFKAKEITYNPVGEIRFTSDSLDDTKAILDSYGITYTISTGDASALNAGKVQCVNITANGQTRTLNVNGDGWTTNFYGATATIYKYKEASLSISYLTNNESRITKFVPLFVGGDGNESYTWYASDGSLLCNDREYVINNLENLNYIKLQVNIGTKTYTAEWNSG